MIASDTMNSAKNTWFDVAGYEGIYQVSPEGQVRRIRKDPRVSKYKVLKPVTTSGGYQQVTLSKNNIRTSHFVHRLVALAFVDGDKSLCVDHIDADRQNNHAWNLRWVTLADNTLASYPRAFGRSNSCAVSSK